MMGYVTAAYIVVLGGFALYWWILKLRMDILIQEEKKFTRKGDSP